MERKARWGGIVLGSAVSLCAFGSAGGAILTFEQRVAAQEALERVRYAHQIGTTKSFEEAVPRAVLEERVTRALKQSVALETIWATPVTAQMLRAEMERQARESRMPERLEELYHALGDDALLVQECLARPALVERLTRNFYQYDVRFHAAARAEAEELQQALASQGHAAFSHDARRRELEIANLALSASEETTNVERVELDAAEYARFRSAAPRVPGVPGSVREGREDFAIDVVLEADATRVRVARFSVPKQSWDAWWATVSPSLDEASIGSVAGAAALPELARADVEAGLAMAALPCQADDTWTSISDYASITKRSRHTAVWTGNEMLVWGGNDFTDNVHAVNTGGRYDPAIDTWKNLSLTNAPPARYEHTAVWTGSRMVVWGGLNYIFPYTKTGGVYDPVTDTWTATSLTGAPDGRYLHAMIWSGSRVVVFGGFDGNTYVNSGGLYDPANDTWSPTSTAGISGQPANYAVWTGSRMIVLSASLNPGQSYDPVLNQWAPISTIGAAGAGAKTAWTGSALIAWYGTDNGGGKRYDPSSDTWSAMSTIGAPARYPIVLVAAGNRIVAWGGYHASNPNNLGWRYDPSTDTWSQMSNIGAPSARNWATGIWTGDRAIVWGGEVGGSSANSYFSTGGRYDPVSNTWTPTAAAGNPTPLIGATALWTGNRMIYWGSSVGANTGSLFDPALNTLVQTSINNAPPVSGSQRDGVWTGSEMIVWPAGGRYDPMSNAWRSMSYANSPPNGGAVVWTGTYMVAWSANDLRGGRYDPATDQWLGVSTSNAPAMNSGFTAIWTGSRMVIWGGSCRNTGGRYDPVNDVWQPTTTVGAPSGRSRHRAVWTGTQMIVAGGDCVPYDGFGGRYDPVDDAWLPFTSIAPRALHSAVWTGREMIVWGGYSESHFLNSGARYFPSTNSWTATSTADAPQERGNHTAVWTGRRMIVWGGSNTTGLPLTFQGMVAFGDQRDDDADGSTVCAGDCNDGVASIHPGAAEACNAIDDDCDAAIDEDAAGVDSDADRIANACDNCVNDRNEAQSDSDDDGEGDPCDANDGSVFVFRSAPGTLEWKPESGAQSYNAYEGDLAVLRAGGAYTQAPGSNPLAERSCGLAATSLADPGAPPTGQVVFALVTSVSSGVEGDLGRNSAGVVRPNSNPCP